MTKPRRGISGGMMIRLSILVVVLISVGLVYYVESRAAAKFNHVFTTVASEKPKDGPAVHEIIGRDPDETKVVGKLFFVEKYVFRRFFGNHYEYYVVYENKAEPRTLVLHCKDELPYHLTSPKPDITPPTQSPDDAPPGQTLGNPLGN